MDVIHWCCDTGAACMSLSWERREVLNRQVLTETIHTLLLARICLWTWWCDNCVWMIGVTDLSASLQLLGHRVSLFILNPELSGVIYVLYLCNITKLRHLGRFFYQTSRLWSPSTWAAVRHSALHSGWRGMAVRSGSSSLQWDFCSLPHSPEWTGGPGRGQL